MRIQIHRVQILLFHSCLQFQNSDSLFPMKRVNDAFPNPTSFFSLCRSPLCFSLCSFSIHECIVHVYSRIWILWFCIFEGIDAESKKREESSSLVKLELGIAGCGHINPVRQKQEKAESSFTAEQLRELYYQTLVFNFIAYGLPVPFHFLLPIWKSIFQSDPSCEYSILNFLWDDMGIMCSELILFLWNFFLWDLWILFLGFLVLLSPLLWLHTCSFTEERQEWWCLGYMCIELGLKFDKIKLASIQVYVRY